jgi:hemerythrin
MLLRSYDLMLESSHARFIETTLAHKGNNMALIDWNADLSVGIASIDDQHKKLIGLLNTLNDAMKSGKAKEALAGILSELINYTAYHFSNEEKYMEQAEYAAAFLHKTEHQKLVKQLLELQKEYAAGKAMITIDIMNFLKDRVAKHIQGSDKKYDPALIAKGIC